MSETEVSPKLDYIISLGLSELEKRLDNEFRRMLELEKVYREAKVAFKQAEEQYNDDYKQQYGILLMEQGSMPKEKKIGTAAEREAAVKNQLAKNDDLVGLARTLAVAKELMEQAQADLAISEKNYKHFGHKNENYCARLNFLANLDSNLH